MIGKTIFFSYNGADLQGEVVDKILISTGQGYVETGYMVVISGKPYAVRISNISQVIL